MSVPRRGLTIVYTGHGKGKTTAAVGLAIRAAGNRMPVFFLQFVKGQWKSGEREILRSLPGVELAVTGRGFTIERLRDPRIPMHETRRRPPLAGQSRSSWCARMSTRSPRWTRSWAR
jgi:ATP:corrinoid adenosyltransferase